MKIEIKNLQSIEEQRDLSNLELTKVKGGDYVPPPDREPPKGRTQGGICRPRELMSDCRKPNKP